MPPPWAPWSRASPPGTARATTATARSSGEGFDQDALTAAHFDWAFGTQVRVTFLPTGKSAVVRINDRFPNHKGRVIDLSKGAATRDRPHRPGHGAGEAGGRGARVAPNLML